MLTAWNAFPTFDRLFDDIMNGTAGTALGSAAPGRAYVPDVDVRSTADEIVFHFDVPGLKESDLDVSIDAMTLTVKGHRAYPGNDQEQVWLGRSYGRFEKSFTLPELVDPERMSAELADGVLTVRVPKKPQAKPRRIPIGREAAAKELGES